MAQAGGGAAIGLSGPIKVLVIGPSKSGKSGAASFLAGAHDSMTFSPGPTVGCRVLSFERGGAALELWDVSGDQSYENMWPAMQKDAEGVLLLFTGDAAGAAREAELWLGWFAPVAAVCAVACFSSAAGAASSAGSPNPAGLAMPAPGAKGAGFATPPEVIAIDGGGDALRRLFDRLVSRIVKRRG